jgi:universal stress protein A
MDITRILAPTDFSEASLEAVEWAADLARRFDAELVLATAVSFLPYAVIGDLGAAATIAEISEEERTATARRLGELVRRFTESGLRCRTAVLDGAPAEAICAEAKHVGADLVVMATSGRTGLPHLLLGSVAEAVVRRSVCPVLTIRAGTHRAALAAGKEPSAAAPPPG